MPESTLVGSDKIALQENVKKVKRELESWRELILQLNSVLLWQQNWYPGAIAGASTAFFLLVWMLEPSFLTTVSFLALLATLMDYIGPKVSDALYSPAQWTGAKEHQFEDICKLLVHSYVAAMHQVSAYRALKYTSPKLYFSVTIISLTFLAFLGSKINNLVLTYLFVTGLLLVPGLGHHGILHKYSQLVLQHVFNVLKGLQGGDKVKVN